MPTAVVDPETGENTPALQAVLALFWKEIIMDNVSFGVTMTLVGVGGTFVSMALIILCVNLLKRVFSFPKPVESSKSSTR